MYFVFCITQTCLVIKYYPIKTIGNYHNRHFNIFKCNIRTLGLNKSIKNNFNLKQHFNLNQNTHIKTNQM